MAVISLARPVPLLREKGFGNPLEVLSNSLQDKSYNALSKLLTNMLLKGVDPCPSI